MLRRIVMILAVAFVAALLSAGSGGPATSTTSGDAAYFTDYTTCPLERIGRQLVRCDILTGAGVEAPFWIPEQK